VERPLLASPPTVTLGVPGTALLGSDVSFSVTFDNMDLADVGYGPIIDVILDTTGADGDDGLGTSSISASYLGIPFVAGQDMFILTFDGLGQATHPLIRDATGSYITVTGTAGDTLVVIRLPFGSFAPNQPPAQVDMTVNMSNFADVGTPLSVSARGGYEFGYTPLDDWCCGDPPDATLSGFTISTVTPTLFTLAKTYSGPEDENATGPNYRTFYPLQYTVTVDIAPGQSLTGVVLTDVLPNNLQFFGLISSSPGGASCTTPGATPGGTLQCTFPGAVSGSATFTFDFYVPLEDAISSRVINPLTGDDVSSCDNASVSGFWTPLDPRDPVGPVSEDPAGCEHTLTDKSIAIQKGVANLTDATHSPGDLLEYTLTYQISDFFAFDGVVVTDVLSDGQHVDSSFTPTLEIAGNGFSLPAAGIGAANFDVSCNYTGGPGPECTINDPAANDGLTTLTFRVSDELITRGQANGRHVGGCVDPAGGSANPDCGTYNDGPTNVTIRFRATIIQEFADDFPSGDPSVDQGDILTDGVTATGSVLSTSTFAATGNSESDTSGSSISILTGTLSKVIYEINGSPTVGDPVPIKPGDEVTFRITYVLPTSDEENLEFQDYLPLPIFDVTDPDDDGTLGPAWTFDPTLSAASPASGVAKFGPSDTFYSYTCSSGATGNPSGCLAPTLTSDATNNMLRFLYGDFDDTRDTSTTVDLLFTVTVTADPFADRLNLTNLARAIEGSTNAGTVAIDGIRQMVLTEPVLLSTKGIIWTSNSNNAFAPTTTGPVTFLDPNNSPRWSGTINSTNLAAAPIDSNVAGVDAGDTVSFAITIENTGSSLNGAFDIIIQDDLPAPFAVPAGGLNLQVNYGDSTQPAISWLGLGGGPDAIDGTADDLFGSGIELVDPVGSGVCSAFNPNLGNNIILITFDLELGGTVTPGTTVNTSSLVNYAGSEGGPNHLATPQTDTAETTVAPDSSKTLIGTEIDNASNASNQAVIGELVIYEVTMTVQEGETPSAQIVDTMDSGLAFVQVDSVTTSADVTHNAISTGTIPTNTTIGNAVGGMGNQITFDLGTVVNTNRDNGVTETIVIRYTAVALNVTGNQSGTNLTNSAVLSWTGGSLPAASAPNVTVIEPYLGINKTVSPNSGDAGDAFTYTITLTGAFVTNSFGATLEDTLPSDMENLALTIVTDTASQVTVGNFDLTGNSLTTVAPFSMSFDTGRQIVLEIDGTVAFTATPGQQIDNSAIARWTSLVVNGGAQDRSIYNPASDERTGVDGVGGALNDYAEANPATSARYTVTTVARQKYLTTSSEAHTTEPTSPFQPGTGNPLPGAIGEVFRYRLVVPLPEGSSPNFQLRDNLPGGLIFVNDDTATVAFVTDEAGISSSSVGSLPIAAIPGTCTVSGSSADGSIPAAPLPCTLDDTNVGSSASTSSDPDSYGNGTDPRFKLGDLVNNDSDSNLEYVVVEFNALLNNTNNNAGNNRNNTFRVYIGGSQIGGNSNTIRVRTQEPSITDLTKGASPTSGDAGDSIDYTITFSNSGASNLTTAFEPVLTDSLPSDMTLTPASLSVSSTGSCATGVDTSNSSGNSIDIRIDTVPAGCDVTVTYSATLDTTVTAGQVLANTAALTYTGLPGTNGTTSNPTGSSTLSFGANGNSGDPQGERNGSGSPTYNDYADSDPASVTVTAITPVKSIQGSTDSGTTGSNLTIGEVVTYRLSTDIPEGTSLAFIVLDTLPGDLTYAGDPRLSFIADSSMTVPADLAGANNGAVPPTFPIPGARVSVSGQDITISLGNLVNNDSDAGDETVMIEFDALVSNTANNQNADTKGNAFTVEINSVDRGTSNTVTATIVEPELSLTKVADDDAPSLGQTITYTLTLSHLPASASDSHDLQIVDVVPAGLTYVGPVLPLPTGWSLDDSSAPILTFTSSGLTLAASSVNMSYTATLGVPPTVNVGDTLTNTAGLTWTSLPGTDTNERTGSGVGPNDYNDSSPETITASEADVTLSKTDGGLSAAPGGSIAYTVTVDNTGNIDALDVEVTDTVPDYTTFDPASSTVGWTCTPDNNAGSTCTFDIGTLAAGATQVLTFAVTVDASLPVTVDETTNDACVAASNEPLLLQGDNCDSDVTPLVATPDLNIDKDDGIDLTVAGATLTYTLTYNNVGDQDASGVEITDEVPTGTTFVSASSTAGWSCVPDNNAGSDCTFSVGSLASGAGGSVTFVIVIDDPLAAGVTQIDNTARIDDDGTNGPDPTPADNQDNDLDFIASAPSNLTKSLIATSQAHTSGLDVAIGEIVTYDVSVTIPPGTLVAGGVLTDVLEPGLAFVDCVSITAGAGLSTSLPGGFSDACNPDTNPTVGPEPPADPATVNQGRRVTYTLGNITNASGSDATLTVRYTAVVLDAAAVVRGVTLRNAVNWDWTGGELDFSGPQVTVVESTLTLGKTAAPTVALPGTPITFTLTVGHDPSSNTDAFDLVLTDVLPADLTYVPGTLAFVTGSGVAPTTLDDSAAPSLTVSWDAFPLGSTSEIEFQATLGNLRPDEGVANEAALEWTSLPDDGVSAPYSLSDYNALSTERFYDPASSVDIYRVVASATVRTPALPETGFAPGRVTALGPQTADYQDLGSIWLEIPSLGVSRKIVGVSLGEGGWDLTWLQDAVGYLESTAFPSLPGNTALTAHAYLPDGLPGPFVDLGNLSWGQTINLHANGLKYTYEVRQVWRVLPEDLSVLRHEELDWLTLITCEGFDERSDSYLRSVVARAVLVEVSDGR